MRWHQRHRHAYGKALEAAFSPGYNFQYPNTSQRYADWQNEGSGGKADEGLTAKGPREEVGHDSESETDGYGSDTDGSDSEIECDVSNMEITEELRQYFAQTERHKEELSKCVRVCVNLKQTKTSERTGLFYLYLLIQGVEAVSLHNSSDGFRCSDKRTFP